MFSLRGFVKGGLLKAIGNMADYQVILNAAGWLEKGVLAEDDLEEIEVAMNAHLALTVGIDGLMGNADQPTDVEGDVEEAEAM